MKVEALRVFSGCFIISIFLHQAQPSKIIFEDDRASSNFNPLSNRPKFHSHVSFTHEAFAPTSISIRSPSSRLQSSSNRRTPISVPTENFSKIFREDDIVESENDLMVEILALNSTIAMQLQQKQVGNYFEVFPALSFSFLPDIGILRQLFQWGTKSAGSYAICHACRVGLGYFLLQANTKVSLEDLIQKAIFACKFFSIASEEVCIGIMARYAPVIYYIVKNQPEVNAQFFCGLVLQAEGCTRSNINLEWNVDLSAFPSHYSNPVPNPYPLQYYNPGTNNLRLINSGFPIGNNHPHQRITKILQFTDIHLDLNYSPFSNAVCNNVLCCRASDGPGSNGTQAGYYGDYRSCDLPIHSFENALQNIALTHPDTQLIYMTGDLLPHTIWNSEATEIIHVIELATLAIQKYLPNARIVPVLGNHDVHPANLFSAGKVPRELSSEYIYEFSSKIWSRWIPPESLKSYLHGGYYSVHITNNFRVIVLNTNLCYIYNFWQLKDHRDPGRQLQWLTHELHKAEKNGEFVHILGHVPVGQEECWSVWSRNFYNIISRFSHLVKAQFYGHTHYDEFQLFYHPEDKGRAISSLFLGASLTPFTNLNPGYKIFYADALWNILDHETWIYDLAKANLNPQIPPRWFKLYQATQAYGIPDVSPASLSTFVHRMSSNATAFNEYYRNYFKAADVSLKTQCDTNCRKHILCRIVTPHYQDMTKCIKIQSEVDGIVLPRKIFENTVKNLTTIFTFQKILFH